MSDFHKRFDIEIGIDEARKGFQNRVCNEILDWWDNYISKHTVKRINTTARSVATRLSRRYRKGYNSIHSYIQNEIFYETLRAVEAIFQESAHLYHKGGINIIQQRINKKVPIFIDQSERDICIQWQNGKFIKTGAKLLDNKIVNDPLDWLKRRGYSTVIQPFEKALRDFVEIGSRPDSLSDVIKDAYEALEALAKIVLNNNQDLSKNREKFVSEIKGKAFHKKVLKEYVNYGCDYRHASKPKLPRPQPTIAEAEFFLYFTGTFIRLAMENWEGS